MEIAHAKKAGGGLTETYLSEAAVVGLDQDVAISGPSSFQQPVVLEDRSIEVPIADASSRITPASYDTAAGKSFSIDVELVSGGQTDGHAVEQPSEANEEESYHALSQGDDFPPDTGVFAYLHEVDASRDPLPSIVPEVPSNH
jgi:hypothetical protein